MCVSSFDEWRNLWPIFASPCDSEVTESIFFYNYCYIIRDFQLGDNCAAETYSAVKRRGASIRLESVRAVALGIGTLHFIPYPFSISSSPLLSYSYNGSPGV
jgi:hypothetical protein